MLVFACQRFSLSRDRAKHQRQDAIRHIHTCTSFTVISSVSQPSQSHPSLFSLLSSHRSSLSRHITLVSCSTRNLSSTFIQSINQSFNHSFIRWSHEVVLFSSSRPDGKCLLDLGVSDSIATSDVFDDDVSFCSYGPDYPSRRPTSSRRR